MQPARQEGFLPPRYSKTHWWNAPRFIQTHPDAPKAQHRLETLFLRHLNSAKPISNRHCLHFPFGLTLQSGSAGLWLCLGCSNLKSKHCCGTETLAPTIIVLWKAVAEQNFPALCDKNTKGKNRAILWKTLHRKPSLPQQSLAMSVP